MLVFIMKRVAAMVPVLAVVALGIFLLLRLTPGDPATIIAGDAASPESVAKIRAALGLSESLPVQFGIWIGKVAHGDLGESYFYKSQVSDLILHRIEPTLALSVLTILIAVAIAVPLGTIAAYKQGGWLDRSLMSFSVLGFSIPTFVLGYIMIWLVSLKWGLLPVQGYKRLDEGVWPFLRHLALPSLTLSIVYIALIARVTRASVQEVLSQDHVRTARAKGVSEARVLIYHGVSNAAVPIVTVIGIGFALLIGGVVVTESVFGIPGLGRLTVDAVLARDFPTVQGVILVFALAYVLVNLLIDLSYVLLDPRIRY
jgi:peptide/nickel transport system permease protein